MRKLKDKQMGPWCMFCPAKTTRAQWRHYDKYACSAHRHRLCAPPERTTLADEQTWMRL